MKRTILPFLVLAALLVSTSAAEFKAKKPKKSEAAEQLFSSETVPVLKIEIDPESIKKLEKYQWQFGPQPDRESVSATIREGNRVYTNVAVHLKGAAGSFRSINENPALTLNFDKNAEGQNFHGLTKMSLNNSVQDPTFVSEQFSRELFLKAGVPTPRATHAKVELNGRDLGLYVLVEGWNKQFLKRHFKKPDGNLYDGGFLKEITDELSVNSGDNPKDQSDRKALAEAAKEPDLAKRQERLEKLLDVDRFLSYLALDIMLWDWDGYAQNKNNWRLFHDVNSGKMVFMPHGLDQLFWKPEGSLLPPMQGLVAKAVIQIPELRTRYFERVRKLRETVFDPATMTNRVRQLAARATTALDEKDPSIRKQHEGAVNDFCSAIVRRAKSIDEQLANPIHPAKFDENGHAPLASWTSKTDFGKPVLDREKLGDGREALHLKVASGSSIGTWRSRIWLEEGRYKVEGRMKTSGIVPDVGDPRGGAGMRLAKGRSDKFTTERSDWTAVNHEFTVRDPLAEMEILCELRGAEGEAWFDLGSIQITKLPPGQPKTKVEPAK